MNAHFPSPSHHRWSRTPRAITVRFAAFVTVVAAVAAWILSAVARMSEPAVLITIVIAAFSASWIATSPRPASTHRVTVIRARSRTS